jgi:hypothetical protein
LACRSHAALGCRPHRCPRAPLSAGIASRGAGHADEPTLPSEQAEQQDGDPVDITLGSANESARGLRAALGLFNEDHFGSRIKMGLEAIEAEWRLGAGLTAEDHANFQYVRHGQAGNWEDIPDHVKRCIEAKEYHGGKLNPGDFDHGHDNMTLEDFQQARLPAGALVL